jgi:rhomboid protease GluP
MPSTHTIILYACAAAVLVPGVQLLVELAGAGESGDRAPTLHGTVQRIWRRPVPLVALGLVVLMAAMAVAQAVHPSIVGALERDPDGGWWRCVTALLVQSSGWEQLIFNGAALLVVAPVAARTLGGWRTVVVYLVAGIASHVVSTAGWAPHGAGNSVAICGLVGALATGYLLRGERLALRLFLLGVPVAGLVLCLVANNHGIGLLVGCGFGLFFALTSTDADVPSRANP